MSSRARIKRLPLLLSLAGGALILLEVGLRLARFSAPASGGAFVVWSAELDPRLDARDGLLRRDAHALWELRPGAAVRTPDGRAELDRINADGYRGPVVPVQRPELGLRIMTLGDSATFGTGVTYAQTYSGRLSAMLAHLGVEAEVIDAGVEGYTIRQGLERYRTLGREYRPNVVIAAFSGANESSSAPDLDDDDKIRLSQERNDGLAGLVRGVRTWQLAAWLVGGRGQAQVLAASEAEKSRARELARDSGKLDWVGRRRVSPSEFRTYLSELRREVGADGARLILVAMPYRKSAEERAPVLRLYTQVVFTTAVSEDAQVLDAHGRFATRAKNDSTDELLFLDDWDPTPLGHDLIAQWLVPLVRDQTRNRGTDPIESLR